MYRSLLRKQFLIFLAFIGFVLFFNSFFNGFVGDDYAQVVDNTYVHTITDIPYFFTTSTFDLGNGVTGLYYKPILLTFYSLIYSSFGINSFFFHFIQVCFTIGNAILVFYLFKKFFSHSLSFLLTLTFLVHPINQDVAAYVSNLQDSLFFFFGLSGLLLSMKEKERSISSLFVVYLLLTLSLLFKETGIAFFMIHFLYIFFFRKERLKEVVVVSLAIIVPYIFIHNYAVGTSFADPHDFQISKLNLFERLLSFPRMFSFYFITFVLPIKLAVNYDWVVKSFTFQGFYLPLALMFFILGVIGYIGRKFIKSSSEIRNIFLFFVSWLFIGILLHLQIIPLDSTVAPHWFYFPVVGLMGIIGLVITKVGPKLLVTKSSISVIVLILLLLTARTFVRNNNFADNVTLTCHDANITGDNFSLENSCGASLFLAGETDESIVHLKKSINLAPHYTQNWYALGIALGKKAELQKDRGLLDQSEQAFKTAIKNDPKIPASYENLGYLYLYYRDEKVAEQFLVYSVKKFPKSYKLWLFLAEVQYKQGHKELAMKSIKKAYELNPNDPEVAQFHYNITNSITFNLQKKAF